MTQKRGRDQWWTKKTQMPIDELLNMIDDPVQRNAVVTKLKASDDMRLHISNEVTFGKYKAMKMTVREIFEDNNGGKQYLKTLLRIKDTDGDDPKASWLKNFNEEIYDEVFALFH